MKYLMYILLFSASSGVAQMKILIQNKSFEELNHSWSFGWYDCGVFLFPEETQPDIHNDKYPIKSFGVKQNASDKLKFVGMVVRDNASNEAIFQKLKVPLEKGKCYELSLEVSVSENYLSKQRNSHEYVNYIEPSILRIWGNSDRCDYSQLLAKTEPIKNKEWEKITLKFTPKDNYRFIMIEAYWDEDKLENGHYCGHILIDNLSDLEEIDCTEKFNTNY